MHDEKGGAKQKLPKGESRGELFLDSLGRNLANEPAQVQCIDTHTHAFYGTKRI